MPTDAIATQAADTPRGIVSFRESLADEVFAFQRAAYPHRRVEWIEPRWRWMFLASARRLGVSPMVWLYRGKTGVTAHQGAIPVAVRIGEERFITGWFVETMTLESVRGKAVGPMLVAKAREDLPFNLSLGQTAQMRELQFRLGWQQVAPLTTYTFVLRGQQVVRGKVAGWLVPLAGGALRAHQALRWQRGRRRGDNPFVTQEVSRFDGAHDRLWEAVAPAFRCAVTRDASYLNWKYVEQPGQQFVRLDLRAGTQAQAVVVYTLLPPDAHYRYRRALVVDLVVPPDDATRVWWALEALRRSAVERGADAIVFDLHEPRLEMQVTRFGFAARGATRFFLASVESLPPETQRVVTTPAHWFLTRGDSDIDRPW